MEASVSEDHPPKTMRGFAALHRDVWRTVKLAPFIFLVLPAIVWFPLDVAIDGFVTSLGVDEWTEVRYSVQIGGVAQWILGTLVVAIQLQTLRIMSKGEPVRFGDAARGGLALWSRMMGVFFAAAWRTGIGFLLLVVPGIYLMVRYSLAYAVAAFEDKSGGEALEASGVHVKGCQWRIFFVAIGALAAYAPLLLAPFFLLPMTAGPVLVAAAGIPLNALMPLIVVALTFVYADRRREWFPAEPVGQRDLTSPTATETPVTGRRGVWWVTALSYASLVLVFVFTFMIPDRLIMDADAAYEAGDYEVALAKYEEAAEWWPDDPYIEYCLGWVHIELGDVPRAERHMARAVELAPWDSDCLLGHATVLVELGRLAEAEVEIEQAEKLDNPNTFTIDYLRTLIRLKSLEEPREGGTIS